MNSKDIRKAWHDFWESQGHKESKPSSLVPDSSDKTVLFNTAWMQPLVPYLMGKPHPMWKRVYNIQKCVRTWDIEDVWDERHLTCFEMMWNWSLWDYFKKEAIEWSYDFLTKYLKIPHDKLWVTVFEWNATIPMDQEAINFWLSKWISPDRIRKLSAKDNFWWPAWEVGPCGPCTEIYYDRWDAYGPADWDLGENDRYTEIWNNVFMEFYKDQTGNYTKLAQQNVDTWMGFERIAMALQDKETIYETDIFESIIRVIEKHTHVTYPALLKKEEKFSTEEKSLTIRFRIIADHIRSSSFILWDWVIPSNEWRGYVLRRIIRRLYLSYAMLMGGENQFDKAFNSFEGFFDDIQQSIIDGLGNSRIELVQNKKTIKEQFMKEIESFQRTIHKWFSYFNESISDKNWQKVITGNDAFKLYDTYWFPIELTLEIAQQKGISVDKEWFANEMETAKEKSRQWTKDAFKRWIDWSKYLDWIPETVFVGYNTTLFENAKLLKEFEVEWKNILIFDKTPFYATGWWQTFDTWSITLDDWRSFTVIDVQKYAGVFLHFVE